MKYLLLIMALIFTTSVAQAKNPEIVEVSPNTYMVGLESSWRSPTKLKTKVLKEVNKFADSEGKIAIPISERSAQPQGGWNTYEYQFKLVDPNSPEATSTPMEPSADAIIESRREYSGDLTVQQEEEGNLYTKLLQLDDLRKKGILTDEEFETQKKKLLEAN